MDRAGNSASFEALPIVRASRLRLRGRDEASPRRADGPPAFVVGAGVDDPAQGALAGKLGLRAIRVGVAWPAAATTPDPGLIAALQRAPAGSR